MNAHDFEFTKIDGGSLKLSDFAGKSVLVVNTASECGLTPQYEGLEDLWTRYRDKGLVVLGVPCNDFGGQEPGTEKEVQTFCTKNYGVDFPLTKKYPVLGAEAYPFFTWAAAQSGEAPKWNFHKYLIGPGGALVASFGSKTPPEDAGLVSTLEASLP